MPSKMPAGAPGPWQPMVSTPDWPSENWILRTAVPLARRLGFPMLSVKGGVALWKLANTQLTNPLTTYVPLPVEVCHVPPPVTAAEVPLLPGETNVPDPV